MWELDCEESWAPKIDAFELWCWGRLLSPLDCKEIQPIHPKGDQSWVFIGSWNSNTLATSWEELTHWKRPWCWEGLGAGGEGDDRGWDGWMASPTLWTWVWVNSGSWWWTGRPGVLQFRGSQRVSQTQLSDWTELNWTETNRTSLVAQMIKNLPAMQKTQVPSLGQEDHLEKEMATHSSILAYRIPWTEEPGGLQSMELQRGGHSRAGFTYNWN